MRRDVRVACFLASALAVVACDSWHGPDGKGGTGNTGSPIAPASDGGIDAKPPETAPDDAQVPDAGDDAGSDGSVAVDTLGDDRKDYQACGEVSCKGNNLCCVPQGEAPRYECNEGCGGTEGDFNCDGPEDCDEGKVCCHRMERGKLKGSCIAAEVSESDSGVSTPQCVSQPDGPEKHIACHVDADCKGADGTPLCRAPEGRAFLGYCVADADVLTTPGHDDVGLLRCGDPEKDGVGTMCNLSAQMCCLSLTLNSEAACDERAVCGRSELQVVCDGPEDCDKGEACCQAPASEDADGGTTPAASMCKKTCADVSADAVTRCHRDEDCTALEQVCRPDPASPWWGRCTAP
jgi:hypothetical protein